MRAYLATAILMALTLTAAPSQQKQCKNHCDIDYNFCKEKAIGKWGEKRAPRIARTARRAAPRSVRPFLDLA